MSHTHDHDHEDNGHHHGHHHHGHHHHGSHNHESDPSFWYSRRLIITVVVVLALVTSACLVLVNPGEAIVITRFGDPVRVIVSPGLALKLPSPIDSAVPVDLRLP